VHPPQSWCAQTCPHERRGPIRPRVAAEEGNVDSSEIAIGDDIVAVQRDGLELWRGGAELVCETVPGDVRAEQDEAIPLWGNGWVQDLIFLAANARSPTRLSKIRIFFMAGSLVPVAGRSSPATFSRPA